MPYWTLFFICWGTKLEMFLFSDVAYQVVINLTFIKWFQVPQYEIGSLVCKEGWWIAERK
jgi:hypothetical protein